MNCHAAGKKYERKEGAQAEESCCSGILSFCLYRPWNMFADPVGKDIDSRVNSDCKSHVQFPVTDCNPMGQHGLFLAALGLLLFPSLLRCTHLSPAPCLY